MNTYKVKALLPLQQGTSERGQWCSRDVIVESTEQVQYPDTFLLHFSGSAVDQLSGISEGDVVEAMWASSVRQFTRKDGNTAYVQEHRCWRINVVQSPNRPF